ncbi:MAG TPA: Gfo/Idh/MocA family oxidoreductase, partial [Flavisolibacter sp.]
VTERGLLHTEKEGAVIRETVPTVQGNYLHYFDGIYDAVRNGGALPVTGRQAINTIRVIEAAFRSSEEKSVVAFSR